MDRVTPPSPSSLTVAGDVLPGAPVSPFGDGGAPAMVVSDLDGTLLDHSGATISQRNIDALRRAEEAEGKSLHVKIEA